MLQIEVETSIDTLRAKDYRVCSAHFDPDDLTQERRLRDQTQRMRLKRNASPKAAQPADRLEETDSKMSEICIIQGCNRTEKLLSFPKDPSTLRQWMLCLGGRLKHPVNSSSTVCSAHFTPDCFINWQQKQSGVADNLILKAGALPSHFAEVCNEQVDPWSQERSGVRGQCDLQQTLVIEETGVSRSTPPRAQSRESNRNSSNMQGRNALMSDIVVKLACLLQLFQRCLKCCSEACSVSVKRKGPIIHVLQRCWSCGNSREWTNQQQSTKPPVQPPLDPTNSLEAKEELVVTSKDIEDEFTIRMKEEGEEELEEAAGEVEEQEQEKEIEEEMEEEDNMMDEEDDEVEADEEEEEEEVEEERIEEKEEKEDEVTEEDEEKKKQKSRKRKGKDSDEEWAPNDEAVMETSDEEPEGSDEKEDDEEESPYQCIWCCDCGKEASADCFRQNHLQVYCCVQCGCRDSTLGHQEGICDVSQAAENSNAEDDGKPTASTGCPGDPESIISQGVITGACQHATTNGIDEPFNNGIDASTWRYDHSKGVCTRRKWGTNQDGSACQLRFNSSHQEASAEKWNVPIYAVFFEDLCGLQRHMRRSHAGKRHLCQDCGVFCNRRNRKHSHVCCHKVKPFPCLSCGRRFRSEARLQLHIQFHSEDYRTSCRYCYETFKQKDKQRHEETHNGENLKFRCPECPKRFANVNTRKAHLSTAHFNRGRFVCKVCDKGFHIEFKLKRHEVVHTGVKPYSCELCDRSFNQPGHLKSHMRVHTGERPFKCHECGLCFNHNVSLKNHIQRKHKSMPRAAGSDGETQEFGNGIAVSKSGD